MRGADTFTESAFTLHRLDDFVPKHHRLRPIRQMVNEMLVKMDGVFAGMYEAQTKGGRPSIAPEKLLRAMLLQVFYSIRSERQLMEQVQYNLLYRWFIGLGMQLNRKIPMPVRNELSSSPSASQACQPAPSCPPAPSTKKNASGL